MPSKLKTDIVELGGKTEEWCVIMDLCNCYEACDDFNIIAAINFLEDLPLTSFHEAYAKYNNITECTDEKVKSKITGVLKEYYFTCFEKEIRYVEPLLVRNLRRESEQCRHSGILKYIAKLHNRIEITNDAFLFHKYKLFTVPFTSFSRIVVRISSYIDPHLLMDYEQDMVQFTIRMHLNKGEESVPRDLLRVVKALSDETRLKILRRIFKQRETTQSLAAELKLTEACVSKHLKLLYEAGVLYKERSGNYIYYYLNTSAIDKIPWAIYEYMG
ncbi:transcriptional repressor SdpR [Oxobacter pfennigii]|uniref:Transcriptional repressor SdpR n=1 Tax=Oxobacter pfennigii TaxID=36849 RepID=A0A0P9ACE5_9CLOT|nr:metalloregulator ArsR/SmtB family transcription factor [Oxobacter pfennigii]KPU42766.1 transcriptional repressor SdpR [Oxobacter pfennigii]